MYHRIILLIVISMVLSCSQAPKTGEQAALISHHDISVTLNPENHTIKCTEKITANFPANTKGSEVDFLMNQAITKISLVDSNGLSLEKRPFSEAPKKYSQIFNSEEKGNFQYYVVKLDQPDSVVNFTLAYEGVIYDTLKTLAQEYARGFATTTGLIDTPGVYLAGASGWIPAQNGNKFTYNLKTYLPLGWQSISQGEETVRGSDGNFQINEWSCDKPMEEVYLIAGKYVITEEDHHGIKVMTYTYQDDPQLTGRYRAATKRYIDMYSEMIGTYPFKKFALVENFWQTGYGMPSFTLLGSQVIRLPFIIGTSYGHEILHNWWGNGVFVDWDKGNWCEGLTNYMADHYYKKLAGEDAAYRRTMLQNYLNYVKESRDFPLSQFTERHDPATQAIGYSKSGMVFHLLNKMLGEEKFLAAVQSFYKNNRFKSASWADIEKEFSTQFGDDLSWFFDQWINRAGAPYLKLEDVEILPENDYWSIAITLSQNPQPYRLLIPIRFSGKPDTTITAMMEKEREIFTFKLPSKPAKIWVDPEFDVFRKLDAAEIPPALSQTFGAQNSIIVLPGEADSVIYEAYKNLAEKWKTSESIAIKSDQEIEDNDLTNKAVWILGAMNKMMPRFKASLPQGTEPGDDTWIINDQEFPAEGHAIVLTARHPGNPDLSWTFIHVSNMDDLPGISRKLPHYGKYGYLVFKGNQNIFKGEWKIENSPLLVSGDQ